MTEKDNLENAVILASLVERLIRWRLNTIKLYWKIRIFFLALRWIPRINLGDVVVYNGSKYTVCNGNRCGCWRLGDLNNEDDGWVKRTECKKVYSLKNIRRSFRAGRSFYMGYWFDTWCRNGIKDWMRRCNIW